MMHSLLAVAAGGAVGAVSRWLLSTRLNGTGFPWGTWTVNIVGSFLIGLLIVYCTSREISDVVRNGLLVGALGGFTTFSAFSLETVQFIARGELRVAFVYIVASVLTCIGMAFLGISVARTLF